MLPQNIDDRDLKFCKKDDYAALRVSRILVGNTLNRKSEKCKKSLSRHQEKRYLKSWICVNHPSRSIFVERKHIYAELKIIKWYSSKNINAELPAANSKRLKKLLHFYKNKMSQQCCDKQLTSPFIILFLQAA